jgi:sulfite reductase (ferredoxin)
VHLGGHLGAQTKEPTDVEDGAFGRKVRGLKVTAAALPDYVERLARRFQEQRTEDETFAQWTARASEADLS